MLSADGKCKTFDQSADGYVRGEGSGAVFLKPLDRALADGVFAQAIRPPTVPPRTSRLRLAVMASHRTVELRNAAHTLAQAARAAGFEPRQRPVVIAHDEEFEDEPIEVMPRQSASQVFDFEAPERIRRAA